MRYTICVNMPQMEPYEVEGLDAAREAAKAEISERFPLDKDVTSEEYKLLDAVDELGAQGGVVSGLPGGYVIDVRPMPPGARALAESDLTRFARSYLSDTAAEQERPELVGEENVRALVAHLEQAVEAFMTGVGS